MSLPIFYRLALYFVFTVLFLSCSEDEAPIQAERTTLTESVYASLSIQPDSLYNAYAAVGGIVEQVFLDEGDSLTPGARIVQIRNTAPQLNAENARLMLQQAQDNLSGPDNLLNEIKEEISIARLRMKNDSVNFIKQRNLWKKNIGTQNTFEEKELAYRTSLNNLQLLTNRLERTEKELRNQLEQARNNYRTALTNTRDFTVNSQINGQVYQMLKEPGEIVSLQEPVAVIGSASRFIIEMQIDEVDIVRVVMDQQVVISLDAYPEQAFRARVSKIYPSKNLSTQTFTVEASFNTPPDRLYAGLSGEANIIVQTQNDVLVIPRQYLTDDNQVKTNDGLITVEPGLTNLDKVEIRSGIDEHTELYLPGK